MTDIKTWSTTAAGNNAAPPDGFPEGMARSAINNSKREYKRAIRKAYEDWQWKEQNDTPTRTSNTTFTVPTDKTAVYQVGRRMKFTDSSTLYGVITDSVFTSLTTVTVRLDSGNLSAGLTAVSIGTHPVDSTSFNSQYRQVAGDTDLTPDYLGSVVEVTSAGYVALPNMAGLTQTGRITIINKTGAQLSIRTSGNMVCDDSTRHYIQNNQAIDFFHIGNGSSWRRVVNYSKSPAPTTGVNAIQFNPGGTDNGCYLQYGGGPSTDPNKLLVSIWANARNWNGRNHTLIGFSSSALPRIVISSSISGTSINYDCSLVTSSGSSRAPVRAGLGSFPSYDTGWFHILWAFDQTSGSESSRAYTYSSLGVDTNLVAPPNVGSSVGISSSLVIGDSTTTGSENYFDGDIAEVYIAVGQWLDLTVQANREKFVLGGKPVNLGADGSLPTGVAPTIYLRKPLSEFVINQGSGSSSSFSNIGTAISNATTSPSD